MASFEDFYNDVFPSVPDCPEGIVKQAVRRSIADFCRFTYIWREDTTAAATSTDGDYLISTTPSLNNVSILTLLYVLGVDSDGNKTKIFPETSAAHSVAASFTGGRYNFRLVRPDLVRLNPVPDTLPASLELSAVYIPNNAQNDYDLPDDLANIYSDAIADGALARIMGIPKKPYSDTASARRHKQDYMRELQLARSATLRQNTQAQLYADLGALHSDITPAVNQ